MTAGNTPPRVVADTTPRWLCVLTLAILPIATFVLYSQALAGPFVFDDGTSVVHNLAMQFRIWGVLLTSNRPLSNVSYAINNVLGGPSPWGFHLGNVLLHAANGLLVYALVRLILRLPRLGAPYGDSHWAALAVSALFLVHPLQTEVAAYISSRSDVLAALFVLGAMNCLALSLRWHGLPRWSTAARVAAAACVLLGVLSKESAAVAPLLLFLLDWAAAGRRASSVLRANWVFYAVLGAGWLLPALVLLSHPEYALSAGFGFSRFTPLQYLYTQAGVIVHYLQLTVMPYGQVLDYDWPLARTLMAPGVLLPGGLLLVGLIAALRCWRRRPLYVLCVLWFFINLAPTSSVLPIADLAAERRMYLPIVGVLGVLALLVADLARYVTRERRASSRVVTGGIAVLAGMAISACVLLTWQRNLLWQNPELLWQDSLKNAPGNPRIHANLGTIYANEGRLQPAREHLERALQLVEEGRSVHATQRHAAMVCTHLASVYLRLGDTPRARDTYRRAMAMGAWQETFLRPRLMRLGSALGAQPPSPP